MKTILDEDFDIFIAYHGTNDSNGSLTKALEIYNILSKQFKCFFHPVVNATGGFTDTPTVAKHSKLFLLVANNSIQTNDKNEINSAGLYREISAFYSSHFNNISNNGNARVYAYNGLSVKRANEFHIVFSGSAHFSEDEDPNAIKNLIDWVSNSLKNDYDDNSRTEIPTTQAPDSVSKPNNPHPYEGIWNLIGEFEGFQGDFRSHYYSSGRLILSYTGSSYKTIYCYSVSKEYEDQARVTAICEGVSTVEIIPESNKEQLILLCDIIARTAIKKLHNSSKHFRMVLTPCFNGDGLIYEMVSCFETRNSKGKLVFKRG